MIQFSSNRAFSAVVRINLLIAGQSISVAQIGGGNLFFDNPMALPAGVGEIVMYIDQTPHRWRTILRPGPEPARVIPADLEFLG